tara:strand:+ start:22 stop:225 length:204 start_codon:yes stop_codon:yes gene_type:complete
MVRLYQIAAAVGTSQLPSDVFASVRTVGSGGAKGGKLMGGWIEALVEASPFILLWLCAVRAQKKDNS